MSLKNIFNKFGRKQEVDNSPVSIYEYIKEHLVNGELPDDFSLPKEKEENGISFADGALDGIAIYHMGRSHVSDEDKQKLDSLMHAISDSQFDKAYGELMEFAKTNTPLAAIDEYEGFIFENSSWLNAGALHTFATERLLVSDNKDMVKFGLETLEVFSKCDQKEIVRTLGLSDEFTIFSLFNMMKWENANEEIFSLAQKVHGWGRIHAVEKLEPENDEIKAWLLKEGCANAVVPAYSALEVYNKAEVRTLLGENPSDEQFDSIAFVIDSLLDEGPTMGISAIEDGDEMLIDFMNQIGKHSITSKICETVFSIRSKYAEQDNDVYKKADMLLREGRIYAYIEGEAQKGNLIPIAQMLEIDFYEALYQVMTTNFSENYSKIQFLIAKDEYRDKAVELFREKIPFDELSYEITDEVGFGKEFAPYNQASYLVQFLGDYPMCGEDIVRKCLCLKLINCRNTAIRTLNTWCQKKNCSLKALSEEIYTDVMRLYKREVHESVKKNIDELLKL